MTIAHLTAIMLWAVTVLAFVTAIEISVRFAAWCVARILEMKREDDSERR